MYPPHLNYTTTLPCKTITMKIKILVIVLVMKSNETWKLDLSDCHSSKPRENSWFEDVFKVSTPAFTQAQSLLIKLNTALLMEFCGRSSHIFCKTFLQLVNGIWLGLKCLVAFKHSSPDMVIKRIKVWWVRHNYSGVTKKIPCEKL